MTDLTPPSDDSIDPDEMPLQVRLRRLRFAWRASVPLLVVVGAIFGGMGMWIAVEQGDPEALLYGAGRNAIVLALVAMMWWRAPGLVLAADAVGIWFRPGP